MRIPPSVVNQASATIDGEIYGNAPDAPVARHSRVSEQSNLEGQLLRYGTYGVNVIRTVEGKSQYAQACRAVLHLVGREKRQFLAARDAPCCPEGQNYNFSQKITCCNALAVQSGQG